MMDKMINIKEGSENVGCPLGIDLFILLWEEIRGQFCDLLYTEIVKKINDNLLPEEEEED